MAMVSEVNQVTIAMDSFFMGAEIYFFLLLLLLLIVTVITYYSQHYQLCHLYGDNGDS